jgi:hypothetical protein
VPAPVVIADLRDRLRADPEAARAYAELKRTLAARFRHDRAASTEAKTPFINALLAGPACPSGSTPTRACRGARGGPGRSR